MKLKAIVLSSVAMAIGLTAVPVQAASPAWTPEQVDCIRGVGVTGHRGTGPGTVWRNGKRYSENTLSSFAYAFSKGACGVETDLRQTKKGGCVVLQHDATWNRMTHSKGKVAGTTCKSAYQRRTPSGDKVATPYQLIDLMSRSKTGFALFELKKGAISTKNLRNVIQYANKRLKSTHQIRFTSSDAYMLRLVKSIDARYQIGWIMFNPSARPAINKVPRYVNMLMLGYRGANNASYVKAAHARGIKVSARGVNAAWMHASIKKIGVDAVVTDRVDLVAKQR